MSTLVSGEEARKFDGVSTDCESMRLLRRSLAYVTVGAGLAGLTSVVAYGPDEVKRQVTSSGLVRVGRAARAVSR